MRESGAIMKGMLIVISGPSGSGKGTLVRRLDPEKGFALSVSATTRKMREGERNGTDYFFCAEEEFKRKITAGELLEHALYCGNYYGTPRSYVEERINEGKVVVLEIEVMGALQVREKFPEAVLIFLMPPSMEELRDRLSSRHTEDAATIEYRMVRAAEEITLIERYDYLVINDEIGKAVDLVEKIAAAELLRPSRNADIIRKFRGGDALC